MVARKGNASQVTGPLLSQRSNCPWGALADGEKAEEKENKQTVIASIGNSRLSSRDKSKGFHRFTTEYLV
jgi:hypothetical protein